MLVLDIVHFILVPVIFNLCPAFFFIIYTQLHLKNDVENSRAFCTLSVFLKFCFRRVNITCYVLLASLEDGSLVSNCLHQ